MVIRSTGNRLLPGHGDCVSDNACKGQQMTDYFRFAFIGFVEYDNGDGTHTYVLRKYLTGGPKPDTWLWPKSLEAAR